MATATTGQKSERMDAPTEPIRGDQEVVLRGIDWKGYTAMLRLRGERNRPKMVYLDGDLYLMSPAHVHEFLKKRLGRLVEVILEELRIPHRAAGETTYRRKLKRGGVEGDETYYLANAARMRGKKQIRLRSDPPPDLAIEVVNAHSADHAVEVYRRFGVPEVWVWQDDTLHIHALQADGTYAPSRFSRAFPYLSTAEITEWIGRPEGETDLDWIVPLRAWVRDVLAPRARGEARPPNEPPAGTV